MQPIRPSSGDLMKKRCNILTCMFLLAKPVSGLVNPDVLDLHVSWKKKKVIKKSGTLTKRDSLSLGTYMTLVDCSTVSSR